MARRTKKVGPAGRFSSRYGVKIRKLIRDIEVIQRAKHVCPSCGHKKVKRIGAGIWKCKKCETIFAGGAYIPRTESSLNLEKILGLTRE